MLKSLLIANRGEIACRVIRTARRMGIRTVAVYSDADAEALHVRQADEVVHIGPSPARESYLVGEKIIAAAKASGAEAIHPGYGFLSENADFAQAVIDAGLVWVGPKPASIRAMGLKDAAKKLMQEAGVPVTPGYLGEDQSPDRLQAEAETVGFPVLIKAVAGGGGKGMRRVESAPEFADMLASCKREAASSFGDDRVLIEKYILSPRHIEVQVFGDRHGNVVHLFERYCSLQRRHQKVIEEAPAPGMDATTREAVCGAAVRAAKAVDYEGAGTIEFIADASDGLKADRIWFMEMNTRLQVEHPVTEAITGVDLVAWQLLVASGHPLPQAQDELAINGHAIEARIYAEDPAKGFLPSAGKLQIFRFDEDSARLDSGFAEGDLVTPFYDPMIAKLIVHGESRPRAIGKMIGALEDALIHPVRNNVAFLINAVGHPDFVTAEIDTGFIARFEERLTERRAPHPNIWRTAARAFADRFRRGVPADLAGFRVNAPRSRRVVLHHHGEARTIDLDNGEPFALAKIERTGDDLLIFSFGEVYRFALNADATAAGQGAGDGALTAPMPGKVSAVDVALGAAVTKGQRILTLEAMKMEHALVAPFDGTVTEINVESGVQVRGDAILARITPHAVATEGPLAR